MKSRLDYPAIRRQISIRQVLELLDHQPTTQSGHRWRGRCPLAAHSGHATLRHFAVDVEHHLFYCFACRRGGNQLDLWVAATNLPLHAATLDLCRRLDIEPATLPITQPPNPTSLNH